MGISRAKFRGGRAVLDNGTSSQCISIRGSNNRSRRSIRACQHLDCWVSRWLAVRRRASRDHSKTQSRASVEHRLSQRAWSSEFEQVTVNEIDTHWALATSSGYRYQPRPRESLPDTCSELLPSWVYSTERASSLCWQRIVQRGRHQRQTHQGAWQTVCAQSGRSSLKASWIQTVPGVSHRRQLGMFSRTELRGKNEEPVLDIFTDADFGHTAKRPRGLWAQIITGNCAFPIYWQAKQQGSAARSTTETQIISILPRMNSLMLWLGSVGPDLVTVGSRSPSVWFGVAALDAPLL